MTFSSISLVLQYEKSPKPHWPLYGRKFRVRLIRFAAHGQRILNAFLKTALAHSTGVDSQ